MPTLEQLIARHGADVLAHVLEHYDREVDIPVTDQPQIQGDVSVLPVTHLDIPRARTPLPAGGVAVMRGVNGGNTHSLHGDGPVRYDPVTSGGGLILGVLTVPDGATAWLAHPEHGYLRIGPGTYEIGRQREEFGTDQRLVAD